MNPFGVGMRVNGSKKQPVYTLWGYMPRIENWEYDCGFLYGNIYDDDRFDEGVYIKTQTVKVLNLQSMTARTHENLYELGKRLHETGAKRGLVVVTDVP